MKLLFVFTGGTIGSTLKKGYISPDNKKPYMLIDECEKKYGLNVDYDIIEPYTMLSENNNGITVKTLAECVLKYACDNYDGIVVTHGTDTLQYSAAALGYVLGCNSIPVVLVSSNYPIDDNRANGVENLYGAIEFIKTQPKGGAWVSYKNRGENVKIHRATRLAAGSAFSDRTDSIMNSYYGSFSDDFKFVINPYYYEKADEILPLSVGGLDENSRNIMRIVPYTGMKYPEISNEVKYILHESYHSGTIDTVSNEAKRFFAETKEKNVKVFLTGVSSEAAYESTKAFNELDIFPLANAAPPAMLVKLWFAVSMKQNPMDIMNKSLCGDLIVG